MHWLGFVLCSNLRIIIAIILRWLNLLDFYGMKDCTCFLGLQLFSTPESTDTRPLQQYHPATRNRGAYMSAHVLLNY